MRELFILLNPKKYCQLTDDPCIEHEEGCDSCPIFTTSDRGKETEL